MYPFSNKQRKCPTFFNSDGSVSQETLSSLCESFHKGVCVSSAGDAAICSMWLIRRGCGSGLSLSWFNDWGGIGFFSKESLRMSNSYHGGIM